MTPSELEDVVNSFFTAIVGTDVPPTHQFNWEELDLPAPGLSELEVPFTLEEVKAAVFDMPTDKAPGPDGFSGVFFRTSWDIIKGDMMLAVNKFHSLDDRAFGSLNTAHYVLLLKIDQPMHCGKLAYQPN
jgi:hypothetical protein